VTGKKQKGTRKKNLNVAIGHLGDKRKGKEKNNTRTHEVIVSLLRMAILVTIGYAALQQP